MVWPMLACTALLSESAVSEPELTVSTTVRSSPVLVLPNGLPGRVICPPLATTVKLAGRLRAGTTGVAWVLDCCVTVIVPLAAPLTVIVPDPLALSLPLPR